MCSNFLSCFLYISTRPLCIAYVFLYLTMSACCSRRVPTSRLSAVGRRSWQRSTATILTGLRDEASNTRASTSRPRVKGQCDRRRPLPLVMRARSFPVVSRSAFSACRRLVKVISKYSPQRKRHAWYPKVYW